MKNNNSAQRNVIRETLKDMCESQIELENFHKRVMERVFGMLANADKFNLHPLVLEHLEAIKKLGNS